MNLDGLNFGKYSCPKFLYYHLSSSKICKFMKSSKSKSHMRSWEGNQGMWISPSIKTSKDTKSAYFCTVGKIYCTVPRSKCCFILTLWKWAQQRICQILRRLFRQICRYDPVSKLANWTGTFQSQLEAFYGRFSRWNFVTFQPCCSIYYSYLQEAKIHGETEISSEICRPVQVHSMSPSPHSYSIPMRWKQILWA